MSYFRFMAVAALSLTAATAAQAATLDYVVSAQATENQNPSNPSPNPADLTEVTGFSGLSASEINSQIDGLSSASATLAADLRTGTIKSGGSSVAGPQADADPIPRLSSAGAFTNVTVSESFQVSGDGSVTFNVLLDGMLSVMETNSVYGSSAQGLYGLFIETRNSLGQRLRFDDDVQQDQLRSFSGDATLAIDRLLTTTLDVFDGDTLNFRFLMNVSSDARGVDGQIASSSAYYYTNTATLGFTTSAGVSLFSSDSQFLDGGPTGPQPPMVPVPASLPLLLAGLAGLWGLRRVTS